MEKAANSSTTGAAAASLTQETASVPTHHRYESDSDVPQQPQEEHAHDFLAAAPPAAALSDGAGRRELAHYSDHGGALRAPEGPPLLWTLDEETVLLHSGEASLKRIRTRLENLLLGVSHALRARETRGEPQDPFDVRSRTAARAKPRPSLDFADTVLAADHAVRRIVGEAFAAFEEDEVVQMVQLCSLADRGVDDCDELVRNAIVVLQALTGDGEAVRSVEHFRKFVGAHGEEMATEQWRHDYVTAIRSLAVGFLREPVLTMASYGSSMNQLVEHEALYIGLLRLCSKRPLGNAPHPAEQGENVDLSLVNAQQSLQARKHARGQPPLPHQPAHATAAKPRTTVSSKHATTYIHTPKTAHKNVHARRPSATPPQPLQPMPTAEDLEPAMGLLMSGSSSSPNSPAKMSRSRKVSGIAPSSSQVQELPKPVGHGDSTVPSERRASASCSRSELSRPPYEPVPEVPQRLSLGRGRGHSMSHY